MTEGEKSKGHDVGMLSVRHDVASAATVRRALADDLRANGILATSVDDVVLVASELVGNAVTHAEGLDDVAVQWQLEHGDAGPVGTVDVVLVQVADRSSALPRLRHADTSATGGRGLAIVAAIATEWGVTEAGRGKQVWARVPVRRAG